MNARWMRNQVDDFRDPIEVGAAMLRHPAGKTIPGIPEEILRLVRFTDADHLTAWDAELAGDHSGLPTCEVCGERPATHGRECARCFSISVELDSRFEL